MTGYVTCIRCSTHRRVEDCRHVSHTREDTGVTAEGWFCLDVSWCRSILLAPSQPQRRAS